MPQQIRILDNVIQCNFFTIYCYLSCEDCLSEVIFRVGLELFYEDLEDFFAKPSFFSVGLEYMWVWFNEAEGVLEDILRLFCWVELHLGRLEFIIIN